MLGVLASWRASHFAINVGAYAASGSLFPLFSGLIVSSLLQVAFSILLSYASDRICGHLQKLAFRALLGRDKEYYEKHNPAVMTSSLTSDIQDVKNGMRHAVTLGLQGTATFLTGIWTTYSKSSELGLLTMAVLATVVLVGTGIARKLRSMSKEVEKAKLNTTNYAAMSFDSIRYVSPV